jgi:hypothetical protein
MRRDRERRLCRGARLWGGIRATVEGEDPEVFAFLGSSRLEEPLNRMGVRAAFHGHAHNGSPMGHTTTQVPVFNVSIPLLRRIHPEQPAFLIYELDVAATPPTAPMGAG